MCQYKFSVSFESKYEDKQKSVDSIDGCRFSGITPNVSGAGAVSENTDKSSSEAQNLGNK